MAMVSATTVVAFDIVGVILVVAMLIVPGATAYLLTDRLPVLLAIAAGVGATSAVGGDLVAQAMAGVAGVLFAITFLVSPRYGALARLVHLRRLRLEFGQRLLITHLEGNHGTASLIELRNRFHWTRSTEQRVLRQAVSQNLVIRQGSEQLRLTDAGRSRAAEYAVT